MRKSILFCIVTFMLCNYANAQVIPPIVSVTDTTQLKIEGAVVMGRRSVSKLSNDCVVYDMSSNPNGSNSILQAFKYIPTLKASDESFSILGKKNTVVYINGKKSRLDENSLMAYLRSLPADNVLSIEVINTPSSYSEGEGDFGIVNINLKQAENDGVSGGVELAVRKTHYVKEGLNVNLNFKKSKFSGTLAAGVDIKSDWKEKTINDLYKNSLLTTSTSSLLDGRNSDASATLILNYEASQKTTIGLFASVATYNHNSSTKGASDFGRYGSQIIDSTITLDYNLRQRKPRISTNLNLLTNFNTKSALTIDVDYLSQLNDLRSIKYQDVFIGDVLQNRTHYEQLIPQRANVVSSKIDYSYINGAFRLNTGLDGYYSKIDNNDIIYYYVDNQYVEDANLSNHFVLDELNLGAYVNLRYKWRKFNISVGSRFEMTNYHGDQKSQSTDFTNTYWNVLPNASLGYTTKHAGALTYSFSHRIVRPSFSSLNPFITYSSPTSYSIGNPYLEPVKMYTHNLMWNYKYLNVQASYQTQRNVIQSVSIVKDNSMVETSPINVNRMDEFSMSVGSNFKYLGDKATLNASISYEWLKADSGDGNSLTNYISNSLNFYLNNSFVLSEKSGWSLNVGLQFATKSKYNNLEYPATGMGRVELQKEFGAFKISAHAFKNFYFTDHAIDVWKQIYETNALLSTQLTKGESAGFGIRLYYTFGNKRVKQMNERNTSISKVQQRIN